MNAALRVNVTLASRGRRLRYGRLASRIEGISVVERAAAAGAVVTDDIDTASRSAEDGRHVLLHEPFRATVEELAGIGQTCRRRGCVFMPGHLWRFRPSTRAVREALDAGSLGEPGLLRAHRWEPRDRDAGGGAVAADIDVAIWFFGGAPDTVYAVARESALQVHLGFRSGGMALIDHVADLPGGRYTSLSLIGSRGAAYADDHHNMSLLYAGDRPLALEVGQGDLDLLGQLAEFASAIREEREPAVTDAATRLALAVTETALACTRDGRAAGFGG